MLRALRLTVRKIPSFQVNTKVKFSTKTPQEHQFFPFGVFTILIKPVALTVGIAGGSVLLAEYAIQYRRNTGRPLIDTSNFRILPEGWIPPGKEVVYGLIAANVAIFGLRYANTPAVSRVLNEYFFSSIYNRRYSAFLLSCFNHGGPFHILANMYVLSNFYPHVQNGLGPERALALYVGGGAFSSLASHMLKLVQRSPVRSIGASGAICALVSAFCFIHPNAKLHPIGLPDLSIKAGDAILVFAAIETTLLLLFRGRLPIDFAAHLGGFAFGAGYVTALMEYRNRRIRG
jgi:membrane associated rhomboid family serine protease